MAVSFKTVTVPADGAAITMAGGKLNVPANPIIPFIEGDGTGRGYLAGERARFRCGGGQSVRRQKEDRVDGSVRRGEGVQQVQDRHAGGGCQGWLPDDTVEAFREFLVGIKGPLTTPVGGGIRSLNVALRQMLDLYVCLRPVQYFTGVPSPVKHPEKVDMVIFRENTEDIYAGIECGGGITRGAEDFGFYREGISEGV